METPPDHQDSQSKPPKKKNNLEGLAHGMQFAVTTIGGLAVGYWLDQRYLPSPLGTLGGLLIGSVLGMYTLAKSLK